VSRSERRREAREGGSNMRKLYLVLAAVAIIGVAYVALSVGSGSGAAVVAPIEIEGIDSLPRLVALAQGVTKGDPDASIEILEFGDYQCPACMNFAGMIKPQIDLSYVETGRVRFIFYDFPLGGMHQHAFLAARAARCADDQGQFWEYHDHLFRMQPRWSAQPSAVNTFVDYASDLGLDRGPFDECLKSDRHAEVVTANMYLGQQLGVTGTPTIMINKDGSVRRVPGDFLSIQAYIEDLLEEDGAGAS